MWFLIFFIFSAYKWAENGYILNLENLIFWPGAYFLALAILTPPVLLFFKRIISHKLNFFHHLLLSILFGLVHLFLSDIIIVLFERLLNFNEHYSFPSLIPHWIENWYRLFHGVLWYWGLITLYIAVYFKAAFSGKGSELDALQDNLRSLQLDNLNAQLNPHLLFNALNNISMVIRRNDNQKAIERIASLSNLLRRSLTVPQEKTSSLREELSFLQEFINIEMLSYEDKVEVKVHAPEEFHQARLPSMLLQPIVENAFKHGVLSANGKLATINIDIDKIENNLRLSVFNSGSNEINWNLSSTRGIGLHHTVHRLRQLYDGNFKFVIKEEKEGLRFIITIPYEE